MRLSAKIGLYTAVLAGVVGGTSAWAITDKAVALSVDGQVRTVHTRAGTVGGTLDQARLAVAQHDAVAPAVSASVHDGSTIVVRRGRQLELTVDGASGDVWTTAPTVDDALGELGYGTAKTVSVPRAARLPLTKTQITLLTPRHILVRVDGKTLTVITTEKTVATALGAAHVSLGFDDIVSASLSAPITDGQILTVKRVRLAATTTTTKLPFPSEVRKDAKRLIGTTIVVQHGKTGLETQRFQFVYVDGKLAGKRLLSTVVTREPVPQITKVGTGSKPVVKPHKATTETHKATTAKHKTTAAKHKTTTEKHKATSKKHKVIIKKSHHSSKTRSSASSKSAKSGGSPKTIARRLLDDRGWGSSQYTCLVNLWNRESGWNVHAHNGSGAYGIPQALPGSKMSSAGPNWHDSAATQIEWGLGYISSRYNTPCGAWGHSQSHGWY